MLTFVETRLFTQLVSQYLTDDEYAALQRALMEAPESGAVVRGSGGVRKLRGPEVGEGSVGAYE